MSIGLSNLLNRNCRCSLLKSLFGLFVLLMLNSQATVSGDLNSAFDCELFEIASFRTAITFIFLFFNLFQLCCHLLFLFGFYSLLKPFNLFWVLFCDVQLDFLFVFHILLGCVIPFHLRPQFISASSKYSAQCTLSKVL